MICFELQCSEELQTAHTTIFPYTIDGVPFWMRYYMGRDWARAMAMESTLFQLRSGGIRSATVFGGAFAFRVTFFVALFGRRLPAPLRVH